MNKDVVSKGAATEILTNAEIREYLPHRYPFLLIDKVIAYEVGKSITAIKNVTCNENFFNGHFPTQPIMPGVLIIEALAQAAGMLYFLTTKTKASSDNWFYFAGIDNARFKRVVLPGDQLQLEAEMQRNKMDLWMFGAKASVDGELVCSVDLKIVKSALKHD